MIRVPRIVPALAALACSSTAAAQSGLQTSVTGVVFTQYRYQLSDTASHANAFDVSRSYLNVLGKHASGVSSRVTVDVYRQTGDGSLRFRLKYAYVAYKPGNSPVAVKLGQIKTAFVDWDETLWDYRMQGTVAMDRAGYLSSSDFGVGLDGAFGQERLNLEAAVVNGESYSGGTGDRRKDFMGRASLRLLNTHDASRVGGLRATVYGHRGTPTDGGVRNRFVGQLSYRSRAVTLAAELGLTADSVAGSSTSKANGRVISGFGVFRIPGSPLAVLGRADVVDPNTADPADRATRVIAGISWQVGPTLRLLTNWDGVSYQGTPTPSQEAARSQALFQAQVTF